MLKGFKPLAAAALCLLGLSAFAQNAAAAQWVDSGRTAYLKFSFFGSFAEHTCNAGTAPIQDYPGTCANDAASGWTANHSASSGLSNEQVNSCGVNPNQLGSACYGLAYAINGQAYAGGLPAACNVGARAVVTSTSMETVEIQYEELDVDFIELAREYVCQ
ncbi:MAG TPA: hypothetical protein VIO83_05915 [Pseudomonas sp.]